MKTILLCGGLGTRLRPVIGEKQKAMASVKGKPFLHILIDYLKTQNVNDFIFACGYKKEEIENYFKDGKDFDIKVAYAVEEEPLGTGGAIRNCLSYIDTDKVFVLNSDTLFKADLSALVDNMDRYHTDLSIIVKKMDEDSKRYGNIKIKDGLIESFVEKPDKKEDNTYINGGIYLIKKSLIENIDIGKSSFENDLMKKWLENNTTIGAVISNASFIDIGTPESYKEINI